MKPFTYGTITINLGASQFLLSERGLLHRAVGLTWDSLVAGVKYSGQSRRYVGVVDDLAARGVADLPEELYPWGKDVVLFDRIVRKYVQSYVDVYWPADTDVYADLEIKRCVCALT